MRILDLEPRAHCARCEPCLLGPLPEAQRDSRRERAAGCVSVDAGLSPSRSHPGISRWSPQRLSAGAQAPSCGPRGWAGLEHSGAERPSLPGGDSPGACNPMLVGHWTRHRPEWNRGPAEDRHRWAQLGARPNTHTHTHTHTHTQTHRQRCTDTHPQAYLDNRLLKGALTTT